MDDAQAALTALTDHLALDAVLSRYADAIDRRHWDLLDGVFTPDAHLDYRSAGGITGPYPAVRAWLAEVLPMFDVTQHLVLNRKVTLAPDGQTGRVTSDFLNPNQLTVDGAPWTFTVGGRYHDHVARTEMGWRITTRVEETLWWDHPMPGLPPRPWPLADDART
jgi:hypothetical protein